MAMNLSRLTAVLCLTFMMLIVPPTAATSKSYDDLSDVYILCNTQNYTAGDAFDNQLKASLTSLQQLAQRRSSYRLLQIRGPGITLMTSFQCRGDLSPSKCSECVTAAVQTASSSCPSSIGSRVQKNGCFLRYEQYSYNVEDSSVVVELCNTQKNTDPYFKNQVQGIVSRVISSAPRHKNLFASASVSLGSQKGSSAGFKLYALAQCQGYLSPGQCADCLTAHSSSWQDCDAAVGSQIHSVSCYYRFETYPFFY
ncbi:hypothetical protein KP509_12G020400 [Ceratopteris richardii]|uniref:Gnk2-homologous domain-containing protein n=1 Tax=Ceratopteris richardii TaxID=49495 RepID=A0A8T2TH85_CERRI|nr:hypothetical protein KP509_12G020400 [Ceratopteris richardii]